MRLGIMRVEIVCRKSIIPSSPTPPRLRNLEISAIDQFPSPVYIGIIFYYAAAAPAAETTKQLQKSLSEILTLFYPLAGRYIKENFSVDCNDQGIDYAEAQVSGNLSQVLNGKLQPELLNQFVPYPIESHTTPLVAAQINRFQCGGLAIGLRISHRLADGFTMSSFVNGWAETCRARIDEVQCPSFCLGRLFPAREIPGIMNPSPMKNNAKFMTRTFVFNKTTISKLKTIAKTGTVQATRVDVVTTLIWQALIKVSKAKYGYLRSSLLTHAVDLRGKTNLPIPESCCGNLFMQAGARFVATESQMGLRYLVALVRDAKKEAVLDSAKALNYGDLLLKVYRSFRKVGEELNKIDAYVFSSWCGFPFYEVDFGWGKPSWVSGVHKPVQMVNLIDTKDDGIEAWLSLEEQEMILFQQQPDIIAFTSQEKRHCPFQSRL